MEEMGVVVEASGGTAKVKMIRSGSCEACSASGSCKAISSTDNVITVLDNIGVKPGQHVEIEIPSGMFLKATFLTYLMPVIMLFVGAALGGKYGPMVYNGIAEDFWQAIVGVVFLLASAVVIRLYDRMLSHDKELMPVIVKVIEGSGH